MIFRIGSRRWCGCFRPEFSITVEALIDENTLWPYWAAFHSQERRLRTRLEMAGEGNAYLSLGLMASSVPWPKFFRYCLSCVALDRATEGETYWHRVHQVPAIEVCALHGEGLCNSNVVFRQGRNRYEYLSAESAIVLMSNSAADKSKARQRVSDQELQLAKSAAWLLTHPHASRSGVELRDRFVWELALRGFATWNGTIRVSRLISNLLSRYPTKWLDRIGCGLATPPHESWLERLLRKPESTQATLRYLLLVNFLGATIESILCTDTPHPFGNAPWPCLNRASTHFGQLTIAQCEVVTTRNGTAFSGRFACLDCGMVYERLGPDSTPGDCARPEDRLRRNWVPVYGPIWDQALRAGWMDERTSLRALAHSLGVDVRTVQRQAARLGLKPARARTLRPETSFCRSKPVVPIVPAKLAECQSQWLQLQRDHPAYGRTSLRKAAQAVHTFLYRHARHWLEQNSAPRRKPNIVSQHADWKDRDVALSSEVAGAASRLRPRKPLIRLTRTAMLREVGATWALTRLSLLPLTRSALERLEEDRVQFAVRRIQAVSSTEMASGSIPPKWRLIRGANIRSDLLAGRKCD